jgi:hypothetical protein
MACRLPNLPVENPVVSPAIDRIENNWNTVWLAMSPQRTGLTVAGTRYIIGWRENASLALQEKILGSA